MALRCLHAGFLYLSMISLIFGSMAEVSLSAQYRRVVLKQHAARMYSVPAFVLATDIVYLPLEFMDAFVFGSIAYWYSHYVRGRT